MRAICAAKKYRAGKRERAHTHACGEKRPKTKTKTSGGKGWRYNVSVQRYNFHQNAYGYVRCSMLGHAPAV